MAQFYDLDIWKVGMSLVKNVYRISKKFPAEERYELTSQIRKASTSILANFAEGIGRYTYADKTAKFIISRGECREVHAFILIAIELSYCSRTEAAVSIRLAEDLSRMLSGLITATRARSHT